MLAFASPLAGSDVAPAWLVATRHCLTKPNTNVKSVSEPSSRTRCGRGGRGGRGRRGGRNTSEEKRAEALPRRLMQRLDAFCQLKPSDVECRRRRPFHLWKLWRRRQTSFFLSVMSTPLRAHIIASLSSPCLPAVSRGKKTNIDCHHKFGQRRRRRRRRR